MNVNITIAALCLALGACQPPYGITAAAVEEARDACAPNGGLKGIVVYGGVYAPVCINGARFHWRAMDDAREVRS